MDIFLFQAQYASQVRQFRQYQHKSGMHTPSSNLEVDLWIRLQAPKGMPCISVRPSEYLQDPEQNYDPGEPYNDCDDQTGREREPVQEEEE